MSAMPWLPTEVPPLNEKVPTELVRRMQQEQLVDLGPATAGALPVAPLEVSKEAYFSLCDAAVHLVDLLSTTAAHLGATSAQRLAALGMRPEDAPLFQDDEAREAELATAITRADVVIGPNGPLFVEYNVAGAVGGLVEGGCLRDVWTEVARLSGEPAPNAIDPLAALGDGFARLLRTTPAWPRLDVVASLRDYPRARTTRLFDLEVQALQAAGIQARLWEPEDYARRESTGLPEAFWANFTVAEWHELGISLDPIRAAIDGGATMIPSQSACFPNSKRLLGLLSEGLDWMSDQDRAFADQWIPWSRIVGDRKVEWRGRTCSLPELLSSERADFVLKHGDAMKGEAVWMGKACDQQTWDALVQTATRNGTDYIAQEYIRPERCVVNLSWPDGRVAAAEIAPVVSPFVMAGQSGGLWYRFTVDPDVPIVSRPNGAIDNLITWV